MLDIKFIRQNTELVKQMIKNRGVDVDIDRTIELDKRHREVLHKRETIKAEQNKASKNIPKNTEEIENLKTLKERVKILEQEERTLFAELNEHLLHIPNITSSDTPAGHDESKNVIVREVGEKPKFDFTPKEYLNIAEALDIIDIETASVVSGSRFGYLKRSAALLEFALVQLTLNHLTDEGFVKKLIKKNDLNISTRPFIPIVPPVLIRPEMIYAMGFTERAGIPKGTDEVYFLDKDNLYLAGTSEQSMGPMHYGMVADEKDLPMRYIGFSTCFRRESGSYGKDTKGILRVHQFDKLEMFTVSTPEKSNNEHKLILAVEEELMQELKIPYRVVRLCTGDLGAASASTYDIETWFSGQGVYRETHSTSNTTDYQARSLNAKYSTGQDIHIVHMLNGTAFAIGRMIIAIIENYQTKNGTISVPKALRKYMHNVKEIK